MSSAKVTLSPKEQELVMNADWILTKNAIIKKVTELFADVSVYYRDEIKSHPSFAAEDACKNDPKISKGENYEGLPWVMLDYPRYFTATDVFAIRTFFWWGEYCSITVQLSGKFQNFYSNSIQNYLQWSRNDGWFICKAEDQWQHHFRESNYQPATSFATGALQRMPFIKIAKKIPLQEWDDIENFLQKSFREILQMLTEF